MMKVNHKTKKITAAISAALATSILATTAFAAAPDSLPVFDTDTKGSITVHKYQTDDENYVGSKGTGLASDIDKIDTTKVSPLANVTFTLFQIGGTDSIGTSAPTYSSELLEQNTSTNKWSYDNIEETKSVITDSEGLAAFTDLNLGRYLVVETKAPNSVVTKSEPFFVDVPMTDTTNNNSWLYDIHAFPKNVVKYDTPDIDKAITDIGNKHETASKGDTLSWIISSATPTTLNDYNKYIISDTLDDKLSFVANSVKITWGTDYNTATEVGADNYNLTVPTSSKGGSISVSFKADYLSSLTESTDTTTYSFFVTYATQVIEAAFDTEGNAASITNGATIEYDYINKPKEDTGKKIINNDDKPEVHSGGLRFTKTNANGEALAGAEFKIATSKDNALNGIFIKDENGNDIVSTSKEKTGYVEFTGLKYGSTGNKLTEGSTTYWVVETKAPQGYQLLTEPKSFEVNYNSFSTTYALSAKLVNNPGLDLPLTGATSAAIISLAGLALVAFAGIMLLKKPKKN